MFNYIALYFLLGIPVSLATVMVYGRDNLRTRILGAFTMLLVWPLLPIAMLRERWLLKLIVAHCLWCDAEVTVDMRDRKTWAEHSRTCPKHPLRSEIERLTAERDSKAKWARHYHDNANRFMTALDKIFAAAGIEWSDGEVPFAELIEKIEQLKTAENLSSWTAHWKTKFEEANAEAFDYKARWEGATNTIVKAAETLEYDTALTMIANDWYEKSEAAYHTLQDHIMAMAEQTEEPVTEGKPL
jgi:hypothetical protein